MRNEKNKKMAGSETQKKNDEEKEIKGREK